MGHSDLLVQRWSVPFEGPPNGLAVIGWDEQRGTFLQHYFDVRNVVRVYELRLEEGTLTLARTQPDFSSFDFDQRYVATVTEDEIDGAWSIAKDHQTWSHDFDLIDTRLATT